MTTDRPWPFLLPLALALTLTLGGCVSTGNLGIVTPSGANPGALLAEAHPFTEIGPAQARVCRYFVIAIAPFGDSSFSTAVEEALKTSGGDALVNVTTSTSLYGFVPIYNILSFTCTAVRGTAVRFDDARAVEEPPAP